ncbi:MAG: hypothetical protein AAF548_14080 [Actinomycetota bacterium]
MPAYGRVDHEYGLTLATTAPDDDGPVWMLNLMKYKERADYGDGESRGKTGREADDEYTPVGPLAAIGAEIVYAAEVDATPLGDGTQWDRVGIVKYPTRKSFIDMQARDDFQKQHVHKEAGMDFTIVMGCQPLEVQPADVVGETAAWDEVQYPPTDDDGELHVWHIVKWSEGGEEAMQGYQDEAAKSATRSGVRFGGWMNVEGTILGDGRTWDQARCNIFPSLQEFIENVVNDPGRLEKQASHREPAMDDTYTLLCRPILNRLHESFHA